MKSIMLDQRSFHFGYSQIFQAVQLLCVYILYHPIFFVPTLFGRLWVKHLVSLDQPTIMFYNNKVVF